MFQIEFCKVQDQAIDGQQAGFSVAVAYGLILGGFLHHRLVRPMGNIFGLNLTLLFSRGEILLHIRYRLLQRYILLLILSAKRYL